MSFYTSLRRAFRLLPAPLRQRVLAGLGAARVERIKERVISHNDIYDAGYFASIDSSASRAAPIIADSIVEGFGPTSVLDVGCGTGALLHALQQRGVAGKGLEYAGIALRYCRERGLDVIKFDLESDKVPFPGIRFDVVVSLEVAEHLPAAVADRFVDLICSHGDQVVFTAATPGQGGTDHVNEQPHQYWIDRFQHRGFGFLEKQSAQWRRAWEREEMASWYYQNLMLFSRQTV